MKSDRFNIGTDYGRSLIRRSLQQLGCGRSVLVDKNGVVLCGNDVMACASSLGFKVRVVETTGDELIVVKRVDMDASDTKGKEMSLVDNLSSQKNILWNADALQRAMNQDVRFDPRRWGGACCMVRELDVQDLFRDGVSIVKKEKPMPESVVVIQPSLFD